MFVFMVEMGIHQHKTPKKRWLKKGKPLFIRNSSSQTHFSVVSVVMETKFLVTWFFQEITTPNPILYSEQSS
jgi:hypothetical protein